MQFRHRRLTSRLAFLCLLPLIALLACEGHPTAVSLTPSYGKPAPDGNGPSVSGSDPTEATQETTLDVRVFGEGFDQGSSVRFLLGGKGTRNIRTNSTDFVGPNELRANVTIAPDADTVSYDIEVTTSRRRRGIGTEMFTVKTKGQATATVTLGEGIVGDEPQLKIEVNNSTELQVKGPSTFYTNMPSTYAGFDAVGDPATGVYGACMVNKRNIDAEMVVALAGELVMGQAPTTIMGSMVWANRETGGVAVSLNFRSDHPLLGDATITVGGNSPINGQAETDPPVDPEESFGVNTPTYQLTGGGVRVINRKGKPKDHFTLECPFEDVVSVRIQLTEGPKG